MLNLYAILQGRSEETDLFIMDEQKDRTEISSLGEFKLIDHLTKNFEINNISSVKGIGDDAAIIDNAGKLTVVTTDMLVEGVHFDMMYTPLLHLGYKCIAVNVSDIYAMNACLLYTSPSPRDRTRSRMPSSA